MKNAKYIATYLSILMLSISQSVYAEMAGRVQFVHGKVYVSNTSTQPHRLKKGDPILESDTVITSLESSTQIKMRDGGYIAVRPDSKFKVESFVFSGVEDGNERSFFSLIRGGIRAITGMIGQKNKGSYRIATTTATIGIRGTDHETYVITPDSPLAKLAPVGTYNKVNQGETVLRTDKGAIAILPNQMGYVGAMDQLPVLQPVNLSIFTATPTPLTLSSNPDLRGGAVVDNAIQEQNDTTGNIMPTPGIQTPITGRSGGPTSPTVVF